jgi:hypothetical protein
MIQTEIPKSRDKPPRAGGYFGLLRLALGGSICGWFLGIFAGALVGSLYGICVNDISLGLDGALLGGAALAILGAAYGFGRGARLRSGASLRLSDREVPQEALED